MPAERTPVSDCPAIPTHAERGIHQNAGRSAVQLALILVASFMVVLDFTIVNIALPSMERDFGVATSVVQWVVTGRWPDPGLHVDVAVVPHDLSPLI